MRAFLRVVLGLALFQLGAIILALAAWDLAPGTSSPVRWWAMPVGYAIAMLGGIVGHRGMDRIEGERFDS